MTKLISNNTIEASGDIKTDSDIYCETLRAKYYDLQTVFASSGGALIVAPTAIFPTQSGNTSIKVTKTTESNIVYCILEITDSSITSDLLSGA